MWDAWCYDIFLSQIAANYEAILSGSPIDDPEYQYSDYVLWQRNKQDSTVSNLALESGIASLDGKVDRIPLPYVQQNPDTGDHSGARFNFSIPQDLREAIRAFTRKKGVTPFMVFLSAYASLLGIYSGKGSALITIPLRGRERPELEQIFGPFTNNLFLPVSYEGHTFSTLLSHVKDETARAFGGEVPSFERLIESINQDLSDTAFFQLQFSYQNVENRGTHWTKGIRMAAGPVHDSDNAHAEISFWMREGKSNMDGALDYRTGLFDEETIANFFDRMVDLIRSAIADPDRSISDLIWQSEVAPPEASTDAPQCPNLLDDLYTSLNEDTDRRIVLLEGGSLNVADCRAVDDRKETAKRLQAKLYRLTHGAPRGSRALMVDSPLSTDQEDTIADPLSNVPTDALNTAAGAWYDRFDESCSRVLIALPFHSAARSTGWLSTIASGRELCLPSLAELSDEVSLASFINTHKPDLVALRSTMLEALLEVDSSLPDCHFLVWVESGASRLTQDLASRGIRASFLLADERSLGVGLLGPGAGWPMAFDTQENGVSVSTVDAMGRPQLSRLDGSLELSLYGASHNPTRTGVTVRRLRNGLIGWPDSDGEDTNSADEVAARLSSIESIRDAHAEVRRTSPGQSSIVAWISQRPRKEMTNAEIRSRVKSSGQPAPAMIINMDDIPRDKTGRVMRRELAHPDRIPEHSKYEPPASETEKAFADIWREVLSLDRISINDTFANLGGNSVQALVILSETQKRLGWSFEPRLLFFQTFRQIVEHSDVTDEKIAAQ